LAEAETEEKAETVEMVEKEVKMEEAGMTGQNARGCRRTRREP
jgi:hypothetical protein